MAFRALHCLHKLLFVRIAESFEACHYLSIKFAVLRRLRKGKGETCHRYTTELRNRKHVPCCYRVIQTRASSETQGYYSGRCDIFGRATFLARKFISRPEEPLGTFSYQTSSRSAEIRSADWPEKYFSGRLTRRSTWVIVISPRSSHTTSETFHDMQITVARATQLCRPNVETIG